MEIGVTEALEHLPVSQVRTKAVAVRGVLKGIALLWRGVVVKIRHVIALVTLTQILIV